MFKILEAQPDKKISEADMVGISKSEVTPYLKNVATIHLQANYGMVWTQCNQII